MAFEKKKGKKKDEAVLPLDPPDTSAMTTGLQKPSAMSDAPGLTSSMQVCRTPDPTTAYGARDRHQDAHDLTDLAHGKTTTSATTLPHWSSRRLRFATLVKLAPEHPLLLPTVSRHR